ncbi:MAG: hypothetical protein F7C32_03785 [Desulfurococcales archaeon]|nr:hypothetical protein [Desulfurococcales archaeon]
MSKTNILLVHHKPGQPRTYKLLIDFVSTVSKLTYSSFIPVEIERIEEVKNWDGPVIALFTLRGGHYYAVEEKFPGRTCGPVPTGVIAAHFAREYKTAAAKKIILAFYKAYRFPEERRQDVEKLARLLKDLLGAHVSLFEYSHNEVSKCDRETIVAPLSLGPSSLTRRFGKAGCRVLSTLLEGGGDLLAGWIAGCIHCFKSSP